MGSPLSAADDKYNRSAKGRARTRRHNARRTDQRNERRVFVGRLYVGTVSSPATAKTINEFARENAPKGESQ